MVEGLRVLACPGARGPRRRHHGDPLVGEVERHLLAAHVQQRLLRRAAGHPAQLRQLQLLTCWQRGMSPPGPGSCRLLLYRWLKEDGSVSMLDPFLSFLHTLQVVYLDNKIVIIITYFIK